MSARIFKECKCKACKASRKSYEAAVRHGHPSGEPCEKCYEEGVR